MKYRLGLDVGTNSIGWAAVKLDAENAPSNVVDMGVRIFSDGREPAANGRVGDSLAVARRQARGARRNRDRKNARVRHIIALLVEFGLISENKEDRKDIYKINPYFARSEAAINEVDKNTLARAILHISKRRGYKSNRKGGDDEKEAKQTLQKIGLLQNYLDKNKITLGQFLFEKIKEGDHIRFRGEESIKVDGDEIFIYPSRKMYENELKQIKKVQSILTDEQWEQIIDVIISQRPLKKQEVGHCEFEKDEERADKSLPISHLFRIVSEVENLRYSLDGVTYEIEDENKDLLIDTLRKQKSIAFSKIKTLLNISKVAAFNLESKSRNKLLGSNADVDMAKIFKEFSLDWFKLGHTAQNKIVQTILDGETDDKIFQELKELNSTQELGLTKELIKSCSKTSFPTGKVNLSVKAMLKLTGLMMQKHIMSWEAATEIYGSHSNFNHENEEVLSELSYYGEILKKYTVTIRKAGITNPDEVEFGRITNPTVHVALNQIRVLVNALIKRFGHPTEIHVELTRDLKNGRKKIAEINKIIAANKKNNDSWKEEYEGLFPGRTMSYNDLLKRRLWEELRESNTNGDADSIARTDVYTGKNISLRQLYSEEIEVEHILPFSKTYDNSMANKTITFSAENRRKGNRAPAEYIVPGTNDFDEMIKRASKLPNNKRWRFNKDVWSTLEKECKKSGGSFLDRQLVDTQYLSRVTAQYLKPIVRKSSDILPVNGKVTALLRNKWRLDFSKQKGTEKERSDNRHHAVDALIVAFADRGMVQRISTETAKEQEGKGIYSDKLWVPKPEALKDKENILKIYDNIVVSYKPDHSLNKKLFEETAYGILPKDRPEEEQKYHGIMKRELSSLKASEIDRIRDPYLKEKLLEELNKLSGSFDKKIKELSEKEFVFNGNKVRSVRIYVINQSIQAIPSAQYKGYSVDSIAFCDIWKVPVNKKGKFTGKFKYEGSFIKYFDALKYLNNDEELFKNHKPHPAAKYIARLFKNDAVLIDGEIKKVAGYSATQNKLDLRPLNNPNSGRNFISVNVCCEKGLKKITVSPDGRIRE